MWWMPIATSWTTLSFLQKRISSNMVSSPLPQPYLPRSQLKGIPNLTLHRSDCPTLHAHFLPISFWEHSLFQLLFPPPTILSSHSGKWKNRQQLQNLQYCSQPVLLTTRTTRVMPDLPFFIAGSSATLAMLSLTGVKKSWKEAPVL